MLIGNFSTMANSKKKKVSVNFKSSRRTSAVVHHTHSCGSCASYLFVWCSFSRLYTLAECIWRELPETRLGECDYLHSCRRSQFWHATRDDGQARHKTLWLVLPDRSKSETLTRQDTSAEATRENPRRGECSHLHSRLVSGFLGKSVQPAT